jgi:hypothetical protein
MKKYFYLLLVSISFLMSCENEKDISKFYFPVKKLEQGKVYEYRFLNKPEVDPQYWYYQTLKADPKAGEKKGAFFTGTLYDAAYRIRQIVSEEAVSNGMMLDDIYLYMYDSNNESTRIQPNILSPSVYPFTVEDTSHIYLYKIKFVYPNDTTHSTTVIKNRRFVGKTTYNYKGKSYKCVEFEVREAFDDDKNGRIHQEYKTKELYAEGIGLIYYKKTIGTEVLEYGLKDIYEMSELEKNFSKMESKEK